VKGQSFYLERKVMSDRTASKLAAWAVGVLTTLACAAAGWAMLQCNALGSEQARNKQEVHDLRSLVVETRDDVKELLRRAK
jgi:hypothetical protein